MSACPECGSPDGRHIEVHLKPGVWCSGERRRKEDAKLAEAAVEAARAAQRFDEAIRDETIEAWGAAPGAGRVWADFRAALDAFAALDRKEG